MKKARPTLGYSEAEYLLPHLLERLAKEFEEADAEMKLVDRMFKQDRDSVPVGAVFRARDRRIQTGVMLLLVASARLEQVIYRYATAFLDAEWFEEHLGRNQLLTKWLLLPRFCEGKEINEDHPAINELKSLIKARNAVAHPKRYDMLTAKGGFQDKTAKEVDRFLHACRKAKSTVADLIQLLRTSKR
jgi:hypothetical protein